MTHLGRRKCRAHSSSSREECMEWQTCQTPDSSLWASAGHTFFFLDLLRVGLVAYHCTDGRMKRGSGWRFARASASSALALPFSSENPIAYEHNSRFT